MEFDDSGMIKRVVGWSSRSPRRQRTRRSEFIHGQQRLLFPVIRRRPPLARWLFFSRARRSLLSFTRLRSFLAACAFRCSEPSRVDSDDATRSHEMLPWGCQYCNTVPQAGQAWVAAVPGADSQMASTMRAAVGLSAAQDES